MIYGLIGEKLGHSYSVPIHQSLGNPAYRLIELAPDQLGPFLTQEDIGGLNVTIPYKRAVMEYCDEISEGAKKIGSVNTIVKRGGRLYGHNTDIDGFLYAVTRAGLDFSGQKVLILGSGGTSLTAHAAAERLNAKEILTVSRKGPLTYEGLNAHRDVGIVVNTTPVGMYPNNLKAPVDLSLFPRLQGVMDVVYNPRRTALLLQAEKLGLPRSGGLPMLVAQAKAAEELFFEKSIPDRENARITAELCKESQNIVLIGMPGSGKSTVGALVASALGRKAIDTDQEIENSQGRPIPEIFKERGEAGFRLLEREAIASAGKSTGAVIMTGGGAVVTPENYPALHQNGRIYCLDRPLELLAADGRPLSAQRGVAELYAQRKDKYLAFCDKVIPNTAAPEDAARMILEDFDEHSCD